MYRDTVWKGRDNIISLAIEQGDDLLSAAQITRCRLVFKRSGQANIIVDSSITPAAFDFSGNNIEVVRGLATRLLVLKLGAVAVSAPIADGLYAVDVYLYDNSNINGVFWDSLALQVRTGDT